MIDISEIIADAMSRLGQIRSRETAKFLLEHGADPETHGIIRVRGQSMDHAGHYLVETMILVPREELAGPSFDVGDLRDRFPTREIRVPFFFQGKSWDFP